MFVNIILRTATILSHDAPITFTGRIGDTYQRILHLTQLVFGGKIRKTQHKGDLLMFTGLKRTTALSIIAVAFNIFMGMALLVFVTSDHTKSFTEKFAIGAYVVTTTFILLALSCGLRGTSQDLALTEEHNATKIRDLKKRIEELESRIR